MPFIDLWKKGERMSAIKFPKDLRIEGYYRCDVGLAQKIGNRGHY
jgi:hypothetical protein